MEHCKDCCCAQSWAALGITKYTGKSIPEHILELKMSAQQKDDLDDADADAAEAQYAEHLEKQCPKDCPHCLQDAENCATMNHEKTISSGICSVGSYEAKMPEPSK